jgi:hypothetical protein
VAKTFDLTDPAQREGYLAETILQQALYGDVFLSTDGSSFITVHDGADMLPGPGQPGFVLVMDDGTVLPVPVPGGAAS